MFAQPHHCLEVIERVSCSGRGLLIRAAHDVLPTTLPLPSIVHYKDKPTSPTRKAQGTVAVAVAASGADVVIWAQYPSISS